ncbi:urea amidolyase [Loktanella sp. 3ANDIMAR09]|uniref:5-oxoprolinase subunit C family protein n=1 Tax=Loktanella sp. 3ANDIMAR09 TaxID=1225657 RepID=UPI0006FBD173|nr:biotin-dependent carboxyltransferase family protein [Loktanella sp. 3ANDIMAR09]KQI69017.1 urea amidolyase [Loktanella sp. 3ANDIMAR09]
MTALHIDQSGPLMTVQDMGRPGRIGVGLSPGGAMDRAAMIEGAALLGLSDVVAGIEMAGLGGTFRTDAPMRFALTGARMDAQIDGQPLRWNASHVLHPGQDLRIGGVLAGAYGYLVPAGGVTGARLLDSLSAHLSVGLGAPLAAGDTLVIGQDPQRDRPPQIITPEDRLSGGLLRIMPGPQTQMFDPATRQRLTQITFGRGARSSRTGSPLDYDGHRLGPAGSRGPVSDFIRAGDVQITGDGTPFVMLAECQTVGGYPRIGTVIADDLPRVAQAASGAPLRFEWVTTAQADAAYRSVAQHLREVAAQVRPLVRDPADIPDLLSYQLIDGVTAGDPEEPTP